VHLWIWESCCMCMMIPRTMYRKKWRYEKFRFGSEMCRLEHSLEGMRSFA
jgi:hypothetical protein